MRQCRRVEIAQLVRCHRNILEASFQNFGTACSPLKRHQPGKRVLTFGEAFKPIEMEARNSGGY